MYVMTQYGTLKWTYAADGAILNSAAIAEDGTIYFGSYAGTFYALTSAGALLWSVVKQGSYIISSPAIGSDGTIYYGAADRSTKVGQDNTGSLYALNPDGSLKWRCILVSPILTSSPALGADGTLYIGSFDYNLHAINSSGVEIWSFKTAGYVRSAPVLAVRKGVSTIYVTSYIGVYALNHDGSYRWSYNTTALISSSPAVGTDGTIFITSRDDYIYAVNPDTGALKWKRKTGWYIYTTPSVGADNTVYFGGSDTYFYALNGFTGAVIWKRVTEGALQVRSSAAIGADNGVYVGLLSGFIIGYRHFSPTSQPSSQPSSRPSSRPSCRPSGAPMSQPSRGPEAAPSSQPSSAPTCLAGHVFIDDAYRGGIDIQSSSAAAAAVSTVRITRCGACTIGTFSSIAGESFCTLCPQGFIAPSTGATQCRRCPYPHTNRKIMAVNKYLQYTTGGKDNHNGSNHQIGEERIRCDAINLKINKHALMGAFVIFGGIIITALGFIYKTSPRHRELKGVDGVKNSVLGLLLVLSNIELCSYIYFLCTITILLEFFPLMWLFLALHTACFMIIVLWAFWSYSYDPEALSGSGDDSGDIEFTQGCPKIVEEASAVKKKKIAASTVKGRDEEKKGSDEKEGEMQCEPSIIDGIRRGDKESEKNPSLGDIYPRHREENILGSNAKVPHIFVHAPLANVANDGKLSTKGSLKSVWSRDSARSSRISRGSYRSTSTGDSRSYLLKSPDKLESITMDFNSIVSHIFWLRREGRYATYGGKKFPLSPKKHNTFLLFSFEVLIWWVAILLQIATIILFPLLLVLFYPMWFLFGSLLFISRIISYRCVWEAWFDILKRMMPSLDLLGLPDKEEEDAKVSSGNASASELDFSVFRDDGSSNRMVHSTVKRSLSFNLRRTEELGSALHMMIITVTFSGGFCFQSIPIVIFVVLNCVRSDDWTLEAYVALFAAGVMLIAGPLCFLVYYYISHHAPENDPTDSTAVSGKENDVSTIRSRPISDMDAATIDSVGGPRSSDRLLANSSPLYPSKEVFAFFVSKEDKRYSLDTADDAASSNISSYISREQDICSDAAESDGKEVEQGDVKDVETDQCSREHVFQRDSISEEREKGEEGREEGRERGGDRGGDRGGERGGEKSDATTESSTAPIDETSGVNVPPSYRISPPRTARSMRRAPPPRRGLDPMAPRDDSALMGGSVYQSLSPLRAIRGQPVTAPTDVRYSLPHSHASPTDIE